MLTERQEKIIKLLEENKRASVSSISKEFYVSEMTVRRDLKDLEALGYIERYNGGAVYKNNPTYLPLDCRDKLHSKEKKLLAECAKKYLKDEITVFIDSSSTCRHIVPLLAEYRSVKMVTNSVHSLLLATQYQVVSMLVGGEYNPRDMCTVGFKALEYLQGININVGFFSSSGYSPVKGIITDWDREQTAVRKAAMKNTEIRIFLFTEEKINNNQIYTVCNDSDADEIIML